MKSLTSPVEGAPRARPPYWLGLVAVWPLCLGAVCAPLGPEAVFARGLKQLAVGETAKARRAFEWTLAATRPGQALHFEARLRLAELQVLDAPQAARLAFNAAFADVGRAPSVHETALFVAALVDAGALDVARQVLHVALQREPDDANLAALATSVHERLAGASIRTGQWNCRPYL